MKSPKERFNQIYEVLINAVTKVINKDIRLAAIAAQDECGFLANL